MTAMNMMLMTTMAVTICDYSSQVSYPPPPPPAPSPPPPPSPPPDSKQGKKMNDLETAYKVLLLLIMK